VQGLGRAWERLGAVQRRVYHSIFNMRIKQSYINIEYVRKIDVNENGRAIIYTKDRKEIWCKSWQIVNLGGHPFILIEEPWTPVLIDNVEETLPPKKPKE